MRQLIIALSLIGCLLAGCGRSPAAPPAPQETDQTVRATTPPLGSLTRRITEDLVAVEMLCPDGQPAGSWRPEPEVVALYQRARLIVANGADFEMWATTAPLPRSRMVWTASSIPDELIVIEGKSHSHGPAGEHAHDVILGHTWLDPINAVAQANAIAEALAKAFPDHAQEFEANRAVLEADLRDIHQRLLSLNRRGVRIIAPKDPLGYLARRYNWTASEPRSQATGPTDPEHPEPVVIQLFTDTHHADLDHPDSISVLWNTGESDATRDYLDVLVDNVKRLQQAVQGVPSP